MELNMELNMELKNMVNCRNIRLKYEKGRDIIGIVKRR